MTRRRQVYDRRPEGGVRAVGYARVSTEQQSEGISLEAQESKIRAMAAVQDADLVDVVVDAASGKSLARPGLERVLALVDARSVNMIIVSKLDRLTRSIRDLADLLDRLERKRVALVSVAEALDTASAGGRLVVHIMGSVSEWERRTIAERTRDALQHKKAAGFRTGEIRYGHRLVAGDGRRLEPDPGEQRTLARLRELRASGLSCREVAEQLNAEGHRTRRGSPWRFQYVSELARRTEEGNDAERP